MSSAMQSLMTDEEWKALDEEVEEELRLEAARKKLAIMSNTIYGYAPPSSQFGNTILVGAAKWRYKL